MSNYKLKYLVVNNFRNITLNSEITKDSEIQDILLNHIKSIFIFSGEQIFAFDGENGYGKTTFFIALEFLFNGENINKERVLSEKNMKTAKKGNSDDKDYLRNSDDIGRNEYFVRAIFDNGVEEIDIVRYVGKGKDASDSIILINGEDTTEEKLNKIFFNSEGLSFGNNFNNFFYLPQDNVFEFLLDSKRGDSLSSLLNIEREKTLLGKIHQGNNTKKTITFKIRKLSESLNQRNEELLSKKKELEDSREDNILEKPDTSKYYEIVELGELNLNIPTTEKIDEKYKIRIEELHRQMIYLKDIVTDIKYYEFFSLESKYNKLVDLKEFLSSKDFKLFSYCYENRLKEDYIFINIKQEIKDINIKILLYRELIDLIEKIKKIPTTNTIKEIKLKEEFKDHPELKEIFELLNNFVFEIKKELESYSKLSQKYQSLKFSVSDIIGVIKEDNYSDLILNEKNLTNACPTCATEFDSVPDLLEAVNKQFDYYTKKSEDTKELDDKIKSFINSEQFTLATNNLKENLSDIEENVKDLKNKDLLIDSFGKHYLDSIIIDYIKDNKTKIDSGDFDAKIVFDEYLVETKNKLGDSGISNKELSEIKGRFENNYLKLFSKTTPTDDIFKGLKELLLPSIEGNINILNEYISYITSYSNQNILDEQIKMIESKVKFIGRRMIVLENFRVLLQNKIHNILEEEISTYEKNIIGQIKLPVYVFSKRIMKNYEGDGILIQYKDGKINFHSKKHKKNPYLNYSQGQLTAVMISILLSLNIFLSKSSNLDFILIDDPIQTLDELNQLTFINLLRYQFSDKQIIISTHEQDFSNLIRYKYWRLGYKEGNLNMKERYLDENNTTKNN